MTQNRGSLSCAFPTLSVLLVSDGKTHDVPAGANAVDPSTDSGQPALFSWGDLDGDDRLDLAVVNSDGTLQVLANAGNGRFEDVTARIGLSEVGNAALALWADYDGDRRLDLFVGARAGASRLFHNEGGSFVDMSAGSGLASEGAVQSAEWFDHDGDGRLDLFLVTAQKNELVTRLFRGLEGGFFELAELPLGGMVTRGLGTSSAEGVSPSQPGTPSGRGPNPRDDTRMRGPISGGSSRAAAIVSGGSVSTLLFPPPMSCMDAIKDLANPGSCIQASTNPIQGRLYPLSQNLFVSSSGLVGIGTTMPAAKLDVNGLLKTSAFLLTTGASHNSVLFCDGQGYANWAPLHTGNVDSIAMFGSGGSLINSVLVQNAGNIGIGTLPMSKLDVAGTLRATGFQMLNGASANKVLTCDNASGNASWKSVPSFAGIGGGGAVNRIPKFTSLGMIGNSVIAESGGNVGIGTTGPAAKLDVAGTLRTTGFQMPTGASANMVLTSDASGTATWQLPSGGVGGSGTVDTIPKFTASGAIGDSTIVQSAGNVGIGTASPGAKLHVAGSARMTDTLTLAPAGDQALNISTGSIYKGGALFIHTRGTVTNTSVGVEALANVTGGFFDTAVGQRALFSNTTGHSNTANGGYALSSNLTGSNNVAIGHFALRDNTAGPLNTASGTNALMSNTTGGSNTALGADALMDNNGSNNVAVGQSALRSNTSGLSNAAVGTGALVFNTSGFGNVANGMRALTQNRTGDYNVAIGYESLASNVAGSRNIALGARAGNNIVGSDNIAIGTYGAYGESATIRMGDPSTHTRAFIAGIRGKTTGVADAIPVLVDSNGQLGTISSSRRFKKDIADMGDLTERLLELRPVVFHYKQEQKLPNGREVPLEYGLIAEEVAEVFPDLVVHEEDGQPLTVKYHLLSSMLLNELKELHARVAALEACASDRPSSTR